MTSNEFNEILRKIDLQSLSDEELVNFHALFSMKEAEASWIIRCREYHKKHFTSDKK